MPDAGSRALDGVKSERTVGRRGVLGSGRRRLSGRHIHTQRGNGSCRAVVGAAVSVVSGQPWPAS